MSWAAIGGAAVGAVGSVISANQASGGGPPKWQRQQQKRLVQQSNMHQQEVAGFSEDQQRAMMGIRDMQGRYDPMYADAQDRARAMAASGVTADDISRFYNPFENDAVAAYLADLQHMRGMQDVAVSDAARAAKAFGGDREAVYRANMQGNMDRTGAMTLANMRMQGYTNAVDAAMRDYSGRLQGNQQLANLIDARRVSQGDELGALNASGLLQQQLAQRQLDAPLDTLRFRSDINNPGSNYGRPAQPGVDPIAAALQGFQGGYQAVQGAMDWWKNRQTFDPNGAGTGGFTPDYSNPVWPGTKIDLGP